jgi:hypothetical protein
MTLQCVHPRKVIQKVTCNYSSPHQVHSYTFTKKRRWQIAATIRTDQWREQKTAAGDGVRCSNIYSDAMRLFTPEIQMCRCWCNTERPTTRLSKLRFTSNCFCPPCQYFNSTQDHLQPHFATNGTIWAYLNSINIAAHRNLSTLPTLTAPYPCINPETQHRSRELDFYNLLWRKCVNTLSYRAGDRCTSVPTKRI